MASNIRKFDGLKKFLGRRSADQFDRATRRRADVNAATRSVIEGLEGRILFAVNTWTLGNGGDWDTAGNWSLGHVPTATEDAVIPNLGVGKTIHHDGNFTDSVHSVTMGTGFVIGGGSLSVATSFQSSATFVGLLVDGGVLGVGTTLQTAVNISLSSGTIGGGTIKSPISVSGAANALDGVTLAAGATVADGATLHVVDGLTFASGGSIVLQGASQPTVLSFDDLSSNSHTLVGGTGSIVLGGSDTMYDLLTYHNSFGGTVTLQSGVTVSGAGTINTADLLGGANTGLINQGTIIASVPATTLNIIGNAFSSAGTLAVNAAQTNLKVMPTVWSNTGTFSQSNGGTIQVDGTITGAVSVSATTGSLGVLPGATFKNATISVADGANLVAAPGNVALNLDNVTVATDWQIGAGYTGVGLSITDGLTLAGSSNRQLTANDVGIVFNDTGGDQTLGGAGQVLFTGTDPNVGLFFNASHGHNLTIGSGVVVDGTTGITAVGSTLGTSCLINQGIIASSTSPFFVNAPLINQGILSTVFGSQLDVNTGPQGFAWQNAAGGVIGGMPRGIISAGTIRLGGSFTNAGTFATKGVTVVVAGTFDLQGQAFTFDPNTTGTWQLDPGGAIDNGILSFNNGATITESAVNQTPFGELNNDTIATNVTLPANAALALAGTTTLANNAIIDAIGTLLVDVGARAASLGGAGQVRLDNNGSLIISTGSTGYTFTVGSGITLHGNGKIVSQQPYPPVGALLVNNGTITAEAGETLFVDGIPLVNFGTLSATGLNSLFDVELYSDVAWQNSGLVTASNGGNIALGATDLQLGTIAPTNGGEVDLLRITDLGGKTTALNATGGVILLGNSAIVQNGTLAFGANASLVLPGSAGAELNNVTVSGTFPIPTNHAVFVRGTFTLAPNAVVNVGGLLAADIVFQDAQIIGSGTIALAGGTLSAQGAFNGPSGKLSIGNNVSVHGAGTISSTYAAPIINNGVIADDNLTIHISLSGAPFTNFGTIDLGTGTINISGTQNGLAAFANAGVIRTTLASATTYGMLAGAQPNITLAGGLLDIYLAGGFHPAFWTTFVPIYIGPAGNLTGNFANFDGLNVGGGVALEAFGIVAPPTASSFQYQLRTIAAPADTVAPTVQASSFPAAPTSGTAPYQFTVTYGDDVAIDVATLSSTNVKVTGPNNYSQFATLVSIDKSNNGTPRTATYQVPAPAGGWAAASGTFTATLQPNSVKDTSGNPVASAALGTFGVVITQAAPILSSTIIGDGAAQRSVFHSFTLNFNQAVTLASGAVTIKKLTTNSAGAILTSTPEPSSAFTITNPSGDGKTWVVQAVANSGIANGFGDFLDGVYQFTVHAALVTNSAGIALAGGDHTQSFRKLFGDINGDGRVSNADFTRFANTFNSKAGDANFVPALDYNHDGRISNTDFTFFASRYGMVLYLPV
ncbi:MAG: hypothetical protein JWL69_264 [Phycisphaerales bacterium]|nr:hypothetical protein [Phycisphaerales bacterium]